MIILYVLLIIIVAIFGCILFLPFYIEINSEEAIYRVRLSPLFCLSVIPFSESFSIELKILGLKKNINIFEARKQKVRKTQSGRSKEKKNRTISWRRIKSVLKSFIIKKCFITFDTGDAALNGVLFPAVYLASFYSGKSITVNFEERNEVILTIKNSFARMVWAYIKN
jgi:hypothetical protein